MKVMQNSKIIQKFNDFIFSRLKNSQRNIEVRNFFLNKFTVSNNLIHRFALSHETNSNRINSISRHSQNSRKAEKETPFIFRPENYRVSPPLSNLSSSPSSSLYISEGTRCLRRFLVRRLEGNRRTIFSSTLPGGEVGQTQKKTLAIQRNAYLCGEGVKKKGEAGFIQGSNYP